MSVASDPRVSARKRVATWCLSTRYTNLNEGHHRLLLRAPSTSHRTARARHAHTVPVSRLRVTHRTRIRACGMYVPRYRQGGMPGTMCDSGAHQRSVLDCTECMTLVVCTMCARCPGVVRGGPVCASYRLGQQQASRSGWKRPQPTTPPTIMTMPTGAPTGVSLTRRRKRGECPPHAEYPGSYAPSTERETVSKLTR